jgi:undecaprenyl-diphosphatase
LGELFRLPLLAVALACLVALAILTALVVTYPANPVDASIARALQSVDASPLSPVFELYRRIGGPDGPYAEVTVVLIVLLLHRQAWLFVIAGLFADGWYFVLRPFVMRPRPELPDLLRITEHPGASSYPSGHVILFCSYAMTLMLCVGLKYIPKRWQPAGWALVILFIAAGGFSRVYSGAHWPSDVLAGLLIGAGWLAFVASIRWLSDPVLGRVP